MLVFSRSTCFQEILTEVNENGENIQEIINLLEPESTNVGNSKYHKATDNQLAYYVGVCF